MAILLDNVSEDTISNSFKVIGGSHIMIMCGDDFGCGTVQVQVASPNDSFNRIG